MANNEGPDRSEVLHELTVVKTIADGKPDAHTFVTDGSIAGADLTLVLDDDGNPVTNDSGDEIMNIAYDEDDKKLLVWWDGTDAAFTEVT